jgi:hypothetical protein
MPISLGGTNTAVVAPDVQADLDDEMLEIVDECNTVLGRAERLQIHSLGLLHRSDSFNNLPLSHVLSSTTHIQQWHTYAELFTALCSTTEASCCCSSGHPGTTLRSNCQLASDSSAVMSGIHLNLSSLVLVYPGKGSDPVSGTSA